MAARVLLSLLASAAIAVVVAMLLRRSPLARRLLDRPNERSLHTQATPRVGGIALLLGALPVAAVQATTPIGILLAAATMLAIISAIDDARSLPVEVRLPAHFAAAAVATLTFADAWTAGGIATVALAILSVVAIAWMTNLFNFMDGADGLAGAMAAIGFGTLALAAYDANNAPLAGCCASLAGASLGFLAWNFPPARLFMGDAGSIPLGFLAGALGLAGIAEDSWPWWFPVMVFSPFIVDATLTLLRRAARRQAVWRAHREHGYQRLVLGGWSKRKLAASACVLMLAVSVSACAALRQEAFLRYVIISAWAVAYALLLAAIERRCTQAPAPDQETPASGLGP